MSLDLIMFGTSVETATKNRVLYWKWFIFLYYLSELGENCEFQEERVVL
jgi:hypothetical protein